MQPRRVYGVFTVILLRNLHKAFVALFVDPSDRHRCPAYSRLRSAPVVFQFLLLFSTNNDVYSAIASPSLRGISDKSLRGYSRWLLGAITKASWGVRIVAWPFHDESVLAIRTGLRSLGSDKPVGEVRCGASPFLHFGMFTTCRIRFPQWAPHRFSQLSPTPDSLHSAKNWDLRNSETELRRAKMFISPRTLEG